MPRLRPLIHQRAGDLAALTTDASNSALGVVLEQFVDGLWRRTAFFSRKLKPAETRYSGYDRELLGAGAVKHFGYFLEGRRFTVYTDHKPLVHLMAKLSDPDSVRQQLKVAYVSQ